MGGSLLGGLMNSSAISSANQQNQMLSWDQFLTAQNQFNQGQVDWSITNQQQQQQQQFANAAAGGALVPGFMQQVVSGAQAAGLSPLAVLGAQMPGVSIAPGASPPSGGVGGSASATPNTAVGNAFKDMGQDASRALADIFDSSSRKSQLQEEYMKSQIALNESQAASLTMEAARRLSTGAPKPVGASGINSLNHFVFGGDETPQWPMAIPGQAAMGVVRGIGAIADPIEKFMDRHGLGFDWYRDSMTNALSQ
jgi:hypothetical protein